jgi:hypothetical protein
MISLSTVTINLTDQADAGGLAGATTDPSEYFSSIIGGIMVVAVLLVLFFLIWGAIEWITAGGDQSKIQKGRDKIVQSIIGIIVLSSALAILSVLQLFLGIEIIGGLNNTSSRPSGEVVCQPGVQYPPGTICITED